MENHIHIFEILKNNEDIHNVWSISVKHPKGNLSSLGYKCTSGLKNWLFGNLLYSYGSVNYTW